MNPRRDPDRLIHAFMLEGAEQLDDQVYDAVRGEIDKKRQRVVIGPWRIPALNKLVPLGLGATALVVAVVVGARFLGPPSSGVGGTPSSSPSPAGLFGGIVNYQLDGAPATTEADVVADGASVSGMAVTTMRAGTHTVRLECAARVGDTWALGGTVEQSTVESSAGAWSAVVVKDGSPQQIGIWLSDPKAEGSDCAGWLAAIDLADLGPETFQPVESGVLVPPPDAAP